MKIILIGTAYPYKGGLASFNERLAAELQRLGHDVEIITFTLQYPSFLFPGKTQYASEPAPTNLRITRSIHSMNPLNWLRVARQIRRKSPDLILIKFWIPLMGACFGKILRGAKKKTNTRVISILDNVVPHEHRPGDMSLIRYFLKPVDAFVAMSRQVLEDLRRFENKKPAILSPHPIYDNYGNLLDKKEARRRLNLAEDGRYVLFFGFIRKYKGLDILLEAMADKAVRDADVRLIVAGEYYGDQDFYQSLMKQGHLEERLALFTDFIPNGDVKLFFSAADVVVQPYRSATQSGISQIAYHFERPMIVTNVGGLPEIVHDGKTGWVTDVSAEAIARAIVTFYEENKAVFFAPYLEAEKQKYSWSEFVQKILTLDASLSQMEK